MVETRAAEDVARSPYIDYDVICITIIISCLESETEDVTRGGLLGGRTRESLDIKIYL